MGKKEQEQECFQTTRKYISTRLSKKERIYFDSVLPDKVELIQTERPDFVSNYNGTTYLIEHFLIDYCNDGVNNNQSQSRLATREINNIYRRYHDPQMGTIKNEDAEDAVTDIEKEVNILANLSNKFDYIKYVEAFKRTFMSHYNKISEYKQNIEIRHNNLKVGFLIEFHCDTHFLKAKYNGAVVKFKGKQRAFPFTKDILNLFKSAIDLDFIIISQYDEGVMIEAKDVRIYEPNRIEESLSRQRICVYDSIFYDHIPKNIVLNYEK